MMQISREGLLIDARAQDLRPLTSGGVRPSWNGGGPFFRTLTILGMC